MLSHGKVREGGRRCATEMILIQHSNSGRGTFFLKNYNQVGNENRLKTPKIPQVHHNKKLCLFHPNWKTAISISQETKQKNKKVIKKCIKDQLRLTVESTGSRIYPLYNIQLPLITHAFMNYLWNRQEIQLIDARLKVFFFLLPFWCCCFCYFVTLQ